MPYLEDGDTKVVQSNAIMRYIARKHNLCESFIHLFIKKASLKITNVKYLSVMLLGGETEEEQVRVDILENQAMDFRKGFAQLCYGDFVSAHEQL